MTTISTRKIRDQAKHAELEKQWAMVIQRQQASGQPINDWCHENGYSRGTFYKWKAELIKKYGSLIFVIPADNLDFNDCNPQMATVDTKAVASESPQKRPKEKQPAGQAKNAAESGYIHIRIGEKIELKCRDDIQSDKLQIIVSALAQSV